MKKLEQGACRETCNGALGNSVIHILDGGRRAVAAIALGVLVAGFPTTDVNAATWTGTSALNSNAGTDAGDDFTPSLANDRLGNWIAVWSSYDSLGGTIGTDSDILFAKSTDNGATWSTPSPVNSNAAASDADDYTPVVASDGQGHWICVWWSFSDLGPNAGVAPTVLYATSADNGSTWSAVASINSSAADAGTEEHPTVASDGQGGWIAAWGAGNSLGGSIGLDSDILYARSSDNGTTWSPIAALNSTAGSDSREDGVPSLSSDGQGNWVATWQTTDFTDGVDTDVMVAKSADGGLTWSAAIPLAAGASTDDTLCTVATDGQGVWIAAWWSDDDLYGPPGAAARILRATSFDNGSTWSVPAVLGDQADLDPDLNDPKPVLANDGQGNWIAAWASGDDLGGTVGTDFDILHATSSDNGVTWTSPLPLNGNASTDSDNDFGPAVATDGQGNWVATWFSFDSLVGTIGTDSDVLRATAVFPSVVVNPCDTLDCDDGVACTVDGCDENTGTCLPHSVGPQPTGVCRETAKAHAVQITNKSVDSGDKLKWRWSGGEETTALDYGDPSDTTGYTVCVFDETADIPVLATKLTIPPGGEWESQPGAPDPVQSWNYRNKTGVGSDGVSTVTMKVGAAGQASIAVKATGENFPTPSPVSASKFFHQDSSVVVQLESTAGQCWVSRLDTNVKNVPTGFKTKQKVLVTQ